MENKNTLIQKLRLFIDDENTLDEVTKLFLSELETEIVKYNSSFKKYFFSKATRNKTECNVKYSNTIFDVIGYFAEQIEGLPNKLNSIVHEEDRLRVENGINEFLNNSNENDYSITYRIIKENDEEIYLHETIHVERDTQGNVLEKKSIYFDISDMEEKKQEVDDFSNEMININRRKDSFISIVSHDLKSPYTTLLGFSEILLNDNNLPEDEKREYLEYIHKSSQHQLNFIEHLLDWSRLRTGRTAIEEQRLNLKNVVSSVVSKFTGIAVRKNIEISQNIQKDIYVKSDEKQLSKAISELLQNALYFSETQSPIFVYGSRFKDGMVEIIVKDKGIGIPETEQESLFKLDEKHSREGTNGEQGSGMGLILVKEIVDKLHGDVWFYSKEDEGSEFHITVPEAQNIILIVDDNTKELTEKKKHIAAAFPNYLVLLADNGYAAMDYINEELPTIIISKDNLPLLSGDEIIKAVRNLDKYFAVSVFVISDEDVNAKYEPFMVEGIYKSSVDITKLIKDIKQSNK